MLMKNLIIMLCALIVFCTSCENEPIDTVDISNFDTINVDSNLFTQLKQVADDTEALNVTCLDFLYAFTLYVFDENDAFETSMSIESDEQFSMFLGNLDERQSISMSFPILGTDDNGEIVEINTSAELKEIIDSCTKDETLGRCEQVITDCYFSIDSFTQEAFEGDYLAIAPTGVVTYYHGREIYSGTWVMFFLGEDLHININLNATEDIEAAYNFDWFVMDFGEAEFNIKHGLEILGMNKQCPDTCFSNEYLACGLDENPEIAEFDLNTFLPCTLYERNEQVDPIIARFYATQTDATTATNEINTSEVYMTMSRNDTLYVSYEDELTGNLIDLTRISLVVEDCD